jgi:hypothetical protein
MMSKVANNKIYGLCDNAIALAEEELNKHSIIHVYLILTRIYDKQTSTTYFHQ